MQQDLLRTKEEYDTFLSTFRASIERLSSEKDVLLSKAPKSDEATSLCSQIYTVSERIAANSVAFFKQDSASLLETLDKKLESADLAAAEKCSMYLRFLGQSEQLVGVLNGGSELGRMKQCVRIYEAVLKLNTSQLTKELEQITFDKELKDLKKPVNSLGVFFVTAQRYMSQLT